MLNDPLAAALAKILNAERIGRREVEIKAGSRLLKRVLQLMQDHRYLGTQQEVQTGQGTVLAVNLLGNMNKCGVIKPRFSTKYTAFEKWEKRYLPGKDFGLLIISTPQGIMTHQEAKQKRIGGKLLAYCY